MFSRWLLWFQGFQVFSRMTSFGTPRLNRLVGFLTVATGVPFLSVLSTTSIVSIVSVLSMASFVPVDEAKAFSPAAQSALCADVFLRPQFDESAQRAAHEAITTDLFNGVEIWAAPFSANNNNHPLWQATLRNPKTGRERSVLIKPRPFGDNDGYARTPMEYVAYELNLMIGMDVVPPVAHRRGFKIWGNEYAEVAVIFRVPDAHRLQPVPRSEWGVNDELFLSDTRILDILIENPDRHIDNFIRGQHWVDGVYRPDLVDQAAGLRGYGSRLDHNNAFGTGGVKKVRARTVRGLMKLTKEGLRRAFHEFMSEQEMDSILARRDWMLSEIDRMQLEVVASND